jgi:hypothetical protein
MSDASRILVAILLIAVPTVEFGGLVGGDGRRDLLQLVYVGR